MSKKKVFISACLLGQTCRYDAKTKISNEVVEAYKDYEIIPFCPEAPVFGTPRERINLSHFDGVSKIVTDVTKRDVTKLLTDEIYKFIEMNDIPDEIVLKSKSPSCGVGTTPIVDVETKMTKFGDGLATEIFKKEYYHIDIKDENMLERYK